MPSPVVAVPSSGRDDSFFRPRNVLTTYQQASAYGSPKSSFDITKDGWVSSFDQEGNFLEVSFEASPDNESVLLMGGSASEAELNQHFFPRMSMNTRALSKIAPRISTLKKNPMSNLKNPMARFSKRSSDENGVFDTEEEPLPVSSGKKRRRNKKLAKRMSKMASKLLPKRISERNSEEADGMETKTSPSISTESAKKLKKKIWKRISKRPTLRMRKKMGSSDGAYPTAPWDDHMEVSSVECAADEISLCDFASIDEMAVVASPSSRRDAEIPSTTTDETSDTSTSCGGSEEEAFTPNMVETTILYHDQRVSTNWGNRRSSSTNETKTSLAVDLGDITDESRNKTTAWMDGGKSISDLTSTMRFQKQLDAFNATELLIEFPQGEENRRRSRSACARTGSGDFANIEISCSNTTGGMACQLDMCDDSISLTSTQVDELISPASATTPVRVSIGAQLPNPIKAIVIPKVKTYESPQKSPKVVCCDNERLSQSPVGRTPPSNIKRGIAIKKQFNYRVNRKPAIAPTRLQMDQAPSLPVGDLRKTRRRPSLKKKIKKFLRTHPVSTTTVAFSAVLFFLRSFM